MSAIQKEVRLQPSKTVEITISPDNKKIVKKCIAKNIVYGVFPIVGNSMTCNDERSIPDGSQVLAYELEIDFNKHFESIWHLLPLNEPILIMGTNRAGVKFFVCKTIIFINAVSGYVYLKSYNPDPAYNGGGLAFSSIESILKVIQIIK
jgi:hypothetical protein